MILDIVPIPNLYATMTKRQDVIVNTAVPRFKKYCGLDDISFMGRTLNLNRHPAINLFKYKVIEVVNDVVLERMLFSEETLNYQNGFSFNFNNTELLMAGVRKTSLITGETDFHRVIPGLEAILNTTGLLSRFYRHLERMMQNSYRSNAMNMYYAIANFIHPGGPDRFIVSGNEVSSIPDFGSIWTDGNLCQSLIVNCLPKPIDYWTKQFNTEKITTDDLRSNIDKMFYNHHFVSIPECVDANFEINENTLTYEENDWCREALHELITDLQLLPYTNAIFEFDHQQWTSNFGSVFNTLFTNSTFNYNLSERIIRGITSWLKQHVEESGAEITRARVIKRFSEDILFEWECAGDTNQIYIDLFYYGLGTHAI